MKTHSPDIYTDFSGFSKLKSQARENSPEALKTVAKQFESVFLNMVLKSMREAKLSDGMLDNDQSKFYREMYDQQLAIHLSGEPGVGLAKMIEKQLGGESSDIEKNMALEDYFKKPLQKISEIPIQESKTMVSSKLNTELKDFKTKIKNVAVLPIQSSEQFVQKLQHEAAKAAEKLGVNAKVLLSQAALETGWGKGIIKNQDGSSSFNLFNIKAGNSWDGKKSFVTTLEYDQGIAKKQKAGFRSYDSFQESFDDYVRLIRNNPRYREALKHANDPERYMTELQKAGYATDPNYADKVMKIYNSDTVAASTLELTLASKK